MKPLFTIFLGSILLFSCGTNESFEFLVQNDLSVQRTSETLALSIDRLGMQQGADLMNYGIKDVHSGDTLVVQYYDVDNDGNPDEILFQPTLNALEKRKFELIEGVSEVHKKVEATCYSRFVPERTDDYTWENDKVAFRVFGPDAQRRFENKLPDPTLASGVDAWLKKVDYPIINKWYAEHVEGRGSYHVDTGEGLDNFHVGSSRGVGGLAVKSEGKFYYSKNYVSWETISTGPIRTSFKLSYADWDANGKLIKESKVISLDKGSNLSRYEIFVEGSETLSAGLTLHEKDGVVTSDLNSGWISYWQPHGTSELGTAIVVAPDWLMSFEEYLTEERDQSNAYAHLKVNEGKTVYYAGFGWKESGQFKNAQEWEAYLNDFSLKLSSPLKLIF